MAKIIGSSPPSDVADKTVAYKNYDHNIRTLWLKHLRRYNIDQHTVKGKQRTEA